jgi:hypothetical protein
VLVVSCRRGKAWTSRAFDIQTKDADGDVDAADLSAVLADVCNEVAAGVDNGDIHGLPDVIGRFLCCRDDRACIGE